MQARTSSNRPRQWIATLQGLVVAAIGTCAYGSAWAQVTVGAPSRCHELREINSRGEILQQLLMPVSGFCSYEGPATKDRIDLGIAPYRSALGPTAAEAYSAYDNGVATYWTSVNAYPGGANNGIGVASVSWFFNVRKDRPDAIFDIQITGGRLQLVDSLGALPLSARADLGVVVFGSQGTFYRFEGFASVDGHGGLPVDTTFFPDWDGFQIGNDNYAEQRSGTNVVGATLNIPGQNIGVDMSNVQTGAEVSIAIRLSVEARAQYVDGTAAMAFIRDPVHLNDADPFLGGASFDFTGLTVLTPVPEPSTNWLFAIGLATLAFASRERFKARAA